MSNLDSDPKSLFEEVFRCVLAGVLEGDFLAGEEVFEHVQSVQASTTISRAVEAMHPAFQTIFEGTKDRFSGVE